MVATVQLYGYPRSASGSIPDFPTPPFDSEGNPKVKKISCRDHAGGVFTVAPRRGRPPVRCTEDNPCTTANKPMRPGSREAQVVITPEDDIHSMTLGQLKAYSRKHFSTISKLNSRSQLISAIERQWEKQSSAEKSASGKTARGEARITTEERVRNSNAIRAISESRMTTEKAEPRFRASDEVKNAHGRDKSLELAQKAKAQLVAQGWEVQGSAKGDVITISAHRGDELLSIVWKDGVAIDQSYSLWSVDKPSQNGEIPAHSLPFDPEWATDGEIAAHLVGMKITWWNRIAGKEEKGVCGHGTISIEHRFDGAGHEIPSERLIKFLDGGTTGRMRLIQLGQLLKVG